MTLLTPPIPELATRNHRRFSVEEYRRMAETGILSEDDNVELLEGWIVEKMTKGARHDYTIQATDNAIRSRLEPNWGVRIQSAIVLADSEPEPDLAVILNPPARYVDRHPSRDDIALLVEVAESSLAQDRGIKLRIYARSNIEVYWIVNLIEDVIEVHWDPSGPVDLPTYRGRRVFRSGESVPLAIGGQQLQPVEVKQILGR
ncbi:MAG: Uma2 family endonuclease [Tepidisphaeraceae bacterium]